MCFKLVATPHGRTPIGNYKDKIIALKDDGKKNDYPKNEKLKSPILIPNERGKLFRFEYI